MWEPSLTLGKGGKPKPGIGGTKDCHSIKVNVAMGRHWDARTAYAVKAIVWCSVGLKAVDEKLVIPAL